MLPLSDIRTHRNPMQGVHGMWLLRAGAQLPRLSQPRGRKHADEMCSVQGHPRGLELAVPDPTRGTGQGEGRVQHSTTTRGSGMHDPRTSEDGDRHSPACDSCRTCRIHDRSQLDSDHHVLPSANKRTASAAIQNTTPASNFYISTFARTALPRSLKQANGAPCSLLPEDRRWRFGASVRTDRVFAVR